MLVRQSLTGTATGQASTLREPAPVYGFKPFVDGGKVVSNKLIDLLRDRDGI